MRIQEGFVRQFPCVLLVVAAGCVSSVRNTTAPPVRADTVPSEAVRWMRRSAEHRGLYLQIYQTAGDRIEELTYGLAPKTWGVILDVDETVLDDMEFDAPRVQRHEPFIESAWAEWVQRAAAP